MLKILAILAATTLTLVAADSAAAAPDRAGCKRALLERFDTDKDGKLSEAERAAAKAQAGERLREAKDRFDADKDGKLSEAEREAARTAVSARIKEKHPQLFARIDRDGDGSISREEFRAARPMLEELRAKHRGGGKAD